MMVCAWLLAPTMVFYNSLFFKFLNEGCVGVLDLATTAYETNVRSHVAPITAIATAPVSSLFPSIASTGAPAGKCSLHFL